MSSTQTRLLAWPLAACLALVAIAPAAQAQVAPSAAEVARYSGLHAAAHRGELAQVNKLLASGAPVDARDPYGRTALHVATFARQREVIKAQAQAGANLGLLENDRYDAVTIASVADDESTLRLLLLELGAPTHRRRCSAGPCQQPALDGAD